MNSNTDLIAQIPREQMVEIIGEAASKVTTGTQSGHPRIEWRDIIDTRNCLIHAYEAVNFEIHWQIVSVDYVPVCFNQAVFREGRCRDHCVRKNRDQKCADSQQGRVARHFA